VARIGEDKFVILTSHNQSFNVESILIKLKKSMQLANSCKQDEFHARYDVGSFSFSPEYFKSSGRLIDLVDKRISESQYSESCSLS